MNYLKIKNFKCFYDIDIPLNGLTILAGANGNGKSTVIQALLYLRRTIEHCATWDSGRYNLKHHNGLNVELNGTYCLALGNSSMILPKNSNSDKILLGLSKDNEGLAVEYEVPENKLWLARPWDSITMTFLDGTTYRPVKYNTRYGR